MKKKISQNGGAVPTRASSISGGGPAGQARPLNALRASWQSQSGERDRGEEGHDVRRGTDRQIAGRRRATLHRGDRPPRGRGRGLPRAASRAGGGRGPARRCVGGGLRVSEDLRPLVRRGAAVAVRGGADPAAAFRAVPAGRGSRAGRDEPGERVGSLACGGRPRGHPGGAPGGHGKAQVGGTRGADPGRLRGPDRRRCRASTLPEVTVANSTTHGEPTLTITGGPGLFDDGSYHEVDTVDARTGMPVSSMESGGGMAPSTQFFQFSR